VLVLHNTSEFYITYSIIFNSIFRTRSLVFEVEQSFLYSMSLCIWMKDKVILKGIRKLTGPKYLIHCCWSLDLPHLSELNSLPSPISSLQLQIDHKFPLAWLKVTLKKQNSLLSLILTNRRKVDCYHSVAIGHSKIEGYDHSDVEGQSVQVENQLEKPLENKLKTT
jgi:hypothetical protein